MVFMSKPLMLHDCWFENSKVWHCWKDILEMCVWPPDKTNDARICYTLHTQQTASTTINNRSCGSTDYIMRVRTEKMFQHLWNRGSICYHDTMDSLWEPQDEERHCEKHWLCSMAAEGIKTMWEHIQNKAAGQKIDREHCVCQDRIHWREMASCNLRGERPMKRQATTSRAPLTQLEHSVCHMLKKQKARYVPFHSAIWSGSLFCQKRICTSCEYVHDKAAPAMQCRFSIRKDAVQRCHIVFLPGLLESRSCSSIRNFLQNILAQKHNVQQCRTSA